MPWCECPACGSSFHVLPVRAESWWARWAPGIPADAPVPLLCANCWGAVRRGTLNLGDLDVPGELLARLLDQVADKDEGA